MDCSRRSYITVEEGYFGGPSFSEHDVSTHWVEPGQLYTWWKNNIERRSKYKVLLDDAGFKGTDQRRAAR
jgi:hypothetical protein